MEFCSFYFWIWIEQFNLFLVCKFNKNSEYWTHWIGEQKKRITRPMTNFSLSVTALTIFCSISFSLVLIKNFVGFDFSSVVVQSRSLHFIYIRPINLFARLVDFFNRCSQCSSLAGDDRQHISPANRRKTNDK